MSLNMHGTQYGLPQHNSFFYKTLKFYWLCSKTSKYNVKGASLRHIALPLTTAVMHVDGFHQTCCNRSAA